MDIDLLNYHIRKYGDTQESLAKYLKLHVNTLYKKKRGEKLQFTQGEIRGIATRYQLTTEDLVAIFFNDIYLN